MAVGKQGDMIISQTSFYGGMGTDEKIGIKNSYADGESIDTRRNPSSMSVLPGPRNLNDNDLDGLITAMTQTPDGIRWGISNAGALYRIDLNNDITKAAAFQGWEDGTLGDILYWPTKDRLYISGSDRFYSYGPIKGSPRISQIFLDYDKSSRMTQILTRNSAGTWTGNGVSRFTYKTGSATSWNVPTTSDSWYPGQPDFEKDNNKCVFLPEQTPIIKVKVRVATHTIGRLTLEIHNEANETIAIAKANVGDINAQGDIVFEFNKADLQDFRNYRKEYHFHLYATNSGWNVATYEQNNLNGMWFWAHSAILMPVESKRHPMIAYQNKILIGNGRYLASWEPSGAEYESSELYTGQRLLVQDGHEITSLTYNDEYVVLGSEKVSKAGTRQAQEGSIGFWDTLAPVLNFKIDTPMGAPKSLYTYQNLTYMIIDGALYVYTGAKQLTKIRTIQQSQSEFTGVQDNTDVYMHNMATRRNVLLIAYPSVTTLETLRYGIYSYGSIDKDYPNSFYYSYPTPDNNNYNSNGYKLTYGGLWNFGDTLYYSYKIERPGNTSYNLALVDNSSLPARHYTYEGLKYDGGMPWRDKELMRVGASFDPLPQGATISLKYRIDNRPWVVDTRKARQGDTEIYFEVNKRFKEAQFGIVGENTGSHQESPRITSVGMNIRDLSEEGKMHK